MINFLNSSKLRNHEFQQFFTDLVSICEQNNAEALLIKPQVDALNTTSGEMYQVLNKEAASDITNELVRLDNERDEALTGIIGNAESFSHHFEQLTRDAALIVLKHFNKHGNGIGRLNYMAETSTINAVIAEWKSDSEFATALTSLQLDQWMNYLETTNTSFNEKYLARVKEQSEVPQISMVDLRKKTTTQYRTLANHIEARATLSANGEYNNLVNQMNILIEKYNLIVTQRQSGNTDTETETE